MLGRGECILHKTILTLTTLALLAPLAAAGPGASVQTLDGDGARCGGASSYWNYGNSTPDGGWSSWGESTHAQCDDHYDYAAVEAHDDQGTLAGASVGADRSNSSFSSSSHDQSWSYDWYGDHQANFGHSRDAWSRDATVETRAGSVSAANGCSTNATSYDSWSYWSDAYSSSSTSDHSDARMSRCGATADANGETVFVGQRCADAWSFNGWYYSSGSYYTWQDQGRSVYGCTTGADASPASAGWGNSCASQWWNAEQGSYEENGTTFDRSYDRSDCATGATVVGPDGAVLFVGQESYSAQWCDETEGCTDDSASVVVARLAWEHNPLGPDAGPVVVVPLP